MIERKSQNNNRDLIQRILPIGMHLIVILIILQERCRFLVRAMGISIALATICHIVIPLGQLVAGDSAGTFVEIEYIF